MAIKKTRLGYIRGPEGPAGPGGPAGPEGPQGAPFRYEDFTAEQLDAITIGLVADVLAAANICHVSTAAPTSDVGKDGDLYVVSG